MPTFSTSRLKEFRYQRLRKLRLEVVDELAESIRAIGLAAPGSTCWFALDFGRLYHAGLLKRVEYIIRLKYLKSTKSGVSS